MTPVEKAKRLAQSTGFMGEIPPARPRYSDEEENAIHSHLVEAAERRWKGGRRDEPKPYQVGDEQEPLKPSAFVPVLEAAILSRTKGGEAAFSKFWDTLAEAILNGEFDGAHRLHVVDNQPVRRMRLRSGHMRLLTADEFSYDDVVRRRLAKCWLSRRSAIRWCQRWGLPVPERWRLPSDANETVAPRHDAAGDADTVASNKSGKRVGTEVVWMTAALKELYPDGDPIKKGHSRDAVLQTLKGHFSRQSGSLPSLDRARHLLWPSDDN